MAVRELWFPTDYAIYLCRVVMYGGGSNLVLVQPRRASKYNQSIHVDEHDNIHGRDGDQESPPNEWSLL